MLNVEVRLSMAEGIGLKALNLLSSLTGVYHFLPPIPPYAYSSRTSGHQLGAPQLNLTFDDVDLAGTGMLFVVGKEPEVEVEQETLRSVPRNPTLAPFTVTIYRLDAR